MSCTRLLKCLLSLGLLVVCGCPGTDSMGNPQQPQFLTGFALFDNIAAGEVIGYDFTDTGTTGREIARGSVDANGGFQLDLGTFQGILGVHFVGDYISPVDGSMQTITEEDPLAATVEVNGGTLMDVYIDIPSTIAYRWAQRLGMHPDMSATWAHVNSRQQVENFFGAPGLFGVAPVDPTQPQTNALSVERTFLNTGFARWALDNNTGSLDAAHRFAESGQDGTVDGLRFGVTLDYKAGFQVQDNFRVELGFAYRDFADSASNQTGFGHADFTSDDTLVNSTGQVDQVPRVRALLGNSGFFDGTNVVQFYGPLDEGDVEIRIGGNLLTNIVDIFGAEGVEGVAPPGNPGKTDISVRDINTNLELKLYNAYTYFLLDGPVTVDEIEPSVVPEGPGSIVRVHGNGFIPGTTATIGGQPAEVLAERSPNVLWLLTPGNLGLGAADIVLDTGFRNTTVSAGILVVEKDAALQEQTTTPIQYVLGANWTFGPGGGGGAATAFEERINWTDDTQGTVTREDHSVDPGSPTRTVGTRTGDSFRTLAGAEYKVANFFSSGSQSFHGFDYRDGLGLGITGFGFSVVVDSTSGRQRSEVAGLWYLMAISVNPTEGTVRQIAGLVELEDSDFGTLSCKLRSRADDGTTEDAEIAHQNFRWNFNDDASFDLNTSLSFDCPFELKGRFDPDLYGAYTIGGTDEEVVFGTLIRVELGTGGPTAQLGAHHGGLTYLGKDESGNPMLAFDFVRRLVACDGAEIIALRFGEGDQLAFDDTVRFDERLAATPAWPGPSGLIEGENGDWLGYNLAYGGITLNLGAFPDIANGGNTEKPMGYGVTRTVPTYASYESFPGDYNAIRASIGFQNLNGSTPTPDFEIKSRCRGLRVTDSVPEICGRPFKLGRIIEFLPGGVAKDAFRGEGVGFTNGTASPPEVEIAIVGFGNQIAFVGTQNLTTPGKFPAEAFPVPLSRGHVTGDRQMATLRDGGARTKGSLTHLIRRSDSTPSLSNVSFNFGGWNYVLDPTDSESIGIRGQLNFNAGTVSGSFQERVEFEDGFITNSTAFETGTFSVGADSTIQIVFPPDNGDPEIVLYGAITRDLECVVLIDASDLASAGLFYGIRQPQLAAQLAGLDLPCNYRMTSFNFLFTDTSTVPPTTQFELSNTLLGNGLRSQVNHIGSSETRDNIRDRVNPRQFFDVATTTLEPNNLLRMSLSGIDRLGYVSPNLKWIFVMPGDPVLTGTGFLTGALE